MLLLCFLPLTLARPSSLPFDTLTNEPTNFFLPRVCPLPHLQLLLIFSHKQHGYDLGWVEGAEPLLETFWGPLAAFWARNGLAAVARRLWEQVATALPAGGLQAVGAGVGLLMLTFL